MYHAHNYLYLSLLSVLFFYRSEAKSVHIFYYLWYGNPEVDGSYKHWNHEVLPHWLEHVNKQFPNIGTKFSPPDNLHSPFYPLKNPYSSRDPETIRVHLHEMRQAGADVAIISWWGQANKSASTDTQGVATDTIIPIILQIADEVGLIKIAFHLEPYPGRSAESVRDDMEYIVDKYSNYSSYYKEELDEGVSNPNHLDNKNIQKKWKSLFYIYDSYHISYLDWMKVLSPEGELTIRTTRYDSVVIGLWLDKKDGRELKSGGFDGIYTYFASEGFSFGSSVYNWPMMCEYCKHQKLRCILSVGPGYNDSLIRPWNDHNSKDRQNGMYFSNMWNAAIEAQPDVISITSFNEWGEGTQIEPTREYDISSTLEERNNTNTSIYLKYGGENPYKYLQLSAAMGDKFRHSDTIRLNEL